MPTYKKVVTELLEQLELENLLSQEGIGRHKLMPVK